MNILGSSPSYTFPYKKTALNDGIDNLKSLADRLELAVTEVPDPTAIDTLHPVKEVEYLYLYLDLEDLLTLVRKLGAGPVHDVGLLDAAVARSRSSAFGADAYPTLELKAAALLHSIARNHALVDGNKRLAWLAAVGFLDLNGRPVEMGDDAAFGLVMEAAEGLLDVADIAARLGDAGR